MKTFITDIEQETLQNENFRKVLHTGQHEQVVVMSLKPNEDIGEEVHEINDQFLRIEQGEATLVIDGNEHAVNEGDAFVVPAGSKHNLINRSSEKALKLYTIYAPPHHKDETVHQTKLDAERDKEDHI